MEESRADGQKPRKYSWLISIAFLVAGTLLTFSQLSPVHGGGADPGNKTPSATKNGDRQVVKLLPDQRAMLGSPKTAIDLKDVFSVTDVGENGQPLEVKILHNGKNVAKATINGDVLTLTWGTHTGKKREILLRATNPQTGAFVDTRFHVELWQPDYWSMILTVVGGLGIFLLGMKNLSEGIQAVAGNRLRRMISAVTDNRFMAVGVGAFVTMLVQSSSITSVITVGFVNAGLMSLTQAIGVIMGANIGTTITGWILVLKVGKFGLPIAGIATFAFLFSRKDTWRYLALTCMGLGMVFFGLELMKDGFATVKELPEFEQWFNTFHADSYFGVLTCAAVGCVLTLLVQSSSATLGITIGLAQIGVIPFETAAALVLGENVGTTITAWLASLAASANAKRAAYFHILFNLLGVAWITAIFPWYISLIRFVVTGDAGATIETEDVTRAIAATHTGFNVANTIIFLPLVGFFAKLLKRIVPEKAPKAGTRIATLDVRMLESPMISIEQSHREVLRMATTCKDMMSVLRQLLQAKEFDENLMQRIFDWEEEMDQLHPEIVVFMTNLLGANVPLSVVDEARRQLRMVDEYESISDYVSRVAKARRKLYRAGMNMPEEEAAQVLHLHEQVAEYLQLVTEAEQTRSVQAAKQSREKATAITQQAKTLVQQFMVKTDHLDPLIDVVYNRQVLGYRRIRDHTLNIAELVAGEK